MEPAASSDSSENDELENSFSSSSDTEDFHLDLDKQIEKQPKIYENTEDFLDFASHNKKIKILLETSPINSNWALKDISLHKKGPLEDKLYARTPIFYYNVRRGNTIIEIYENQQTTPTRVFCRRGLRKFYDICSEFINYTKALTKSEKFLPFLTGFQKKMRKIIFEHIENLSLNPSTDWSSLKLNKIYKENGEHCQISYITLIDSWIIASKNVTILIRTPEDLQHYNKERHYWPKIIAETWFEFLKKLPNQKLVKMKERFNGLTLLGEHCGNPKHTHIIRYNEIEIIFYAIVENANPKSCCLSPEKSFKIFEEFGLKNSKIEVFTNFLDFDDFLTKTKNLAEEIEISSCEKEGEGAVVYITYQDEVISMCKMKTLEYLVLRNLREHLKKQIKKPNIQRKQKFNEDVRLLFKGKDFEKQREYYFELGRVAFEYIDNSENNVSFNQIYYCFVDLLKIFFDKLKNFDFKKNITNDFQLVLISPPLFLGPSTNDLMRKHLGVEEISTNWRDDENDINPGLNVYNLHLIPRINGKVSKEKVLFIIAGFSQKMMEKCLDEMDEIDKNEGGIQKNPGLFAFVNKTNRKQRMQKLELLKQKIPVFLKSLQNYNYDVVVDEKEEIKQIEFLEDSSNLLKKKNFSLISKDEKSREIIILLPLGLPGMGKSYFINILSEIFEENKNIAFTYLSTDKIRHEIEDENPDFKIDPLKTFKKCAKETTRRFYQRVSETLNDMKHRKFEKQVLYFDKIHTQTILETTFERIYENMNDPQIKIRIFGLIPTHSEKNFTIKEHQYPFSANFILVCLYRCLMREHHESLDQDPIYRVKVLLKFVQIYRDIKITKMEGFEGFIEMPFIKEGGLKHQNKLDNLIGLIAKALEIISPKSHPEDSPIFLSIVQEFYKVFTIPPEEDSKEEIKKCVAQKLKEILS